MLNQRLQQKLLQKLSPQQILLMKLLQIPTMALEQRIKQEIEENPALEEASTLDDQNEIDDRDASGEDVSEEEFEYDSKDDEFDLNDYMDDDEIPSYKLSANNQSADDERKDIPYASGLSFQEMLLSQLGLRLLTEKQTTIAETIIGNLDDSGYLQRDVSAMVDDLAFAQNITVSDDEILEVLSVVQEFDPSGIGARTLQTVREAYPNNAFIGMGMEITRSHHEWWNGRGYPEGLAGEAIPLSARIMAVADVYDALRMERCYKPAFSHEKSVAIIQEGKGTQFDPVVVEAFLKLEKTFRETVENFQ